MHAFLRYSALAATFLLFTACSGGGGALPGGGPLQLQNFQEAAVIMHQLDGTGRASNAGQTSINDIGISAPFGGATHGGGFYIPDQGNRRLLASPSDAAALVDWSSPRPVERSPAPCACASDWPPASNSSR